MITNKDSTCPKCNGQLKYYDNVSRIARTKGGIGYSIKIRRFKCTNCSSVHRELSDRLVPYKQYEADVIEGVLEGFITSDTIGFEDHPCEMTMRRWRAQKLQGVL